VDELVVRYLRRVDRDRLAPILDAWVATYVDSLDEAVQCDSWLFGTSYSSFLVLH
jgi:hypothetical protein